MGIRLVASVYSGLAFLAVAICLAFYPMTQAKTRQMADELAERRKKFGSA
jgi:Na+/melibiose symporter-like transporter